MQAVLSHHLEIKSICRHSSGLYENTKQKKETVLHCAAANGKSEISSALLKSLNFSDKISLISSPENDGMKAFYWSCSEDHLEFTKWLLDEYKACRLESGPLLHTI